MTRALALAGLVVLCAGIAQAANPVSDRAGLLAALTAAKGGEVIVLADGSYGTLTLAARFASDVTLRSATPLGARFAAITLRDCSYLTLEGLHVAASSNGNWDQPLLSVDASDHISVVNSEINGPLDAARPIAGYFGIRVRSSSDIIVQNTFAHDVLNGMAFFGVDRLTLVNSRVDLVGADSFKFSGLNTALIANNIGAKLTYADDKAHEDFMQFQGSASSNVTIRGNVFLPQNVFDVQGIFVAGKGGHSNILIEQNIIHSSMANGISVAKDSSGITIRNNSLIASDGDVTRISAPSGALVSGNITSGRRGVLQGDNLSIQGSDASAPYYTGSLFAGWALAKGLTIADLRPLPGSLAQSLGAVSRLRDLLP